MFISEDQPVCSPSSFHSVQQSLIQTNRGGGAARQLSWIIKTKPWSLRDCKERKEKLCVCDDRATASLLRGQRRGTVFRRNNLSLFLPVILWMN